MNELILTGIQIATSIWEVWMCYQFLFITVFDRNNITKRERFVMYCIVVLVGSVLGLNRCGAFFSSTMFVFVNILIILCVSWRRRKKILIIGVIFLFFSIVAIIDMVVAFVCLEFMGSTFLSKIYVYAMTVEKEIIFILSRSLVCTGIYVLEKRVKNMYELAEKCKYIILCAGIIFIVLLIKYQYILGGMLIGDIEIKGISAGFGLGIATIVLILLEIFVLSYRYMKQEKNAILLRAQLLEERYIEMMKTRQVLHDMRNHLLLLQKYEKEQQWEKLHKYLNVISEELFEDSTRVWSGNVIVDMMLNSKKLYAEERAIKVEIDTEVVLQFPLNNREIISLFGNLLDNAIEACEKMKKNKKWIYIRIQKRYELLSIEIENSIEQVPKEKRGELISDKTDSGIHGYGLKNVRQIVDEHNGTYSYQIKENSFFTSIAFFDNEFIA